MTTSQQLIDAIADMREGDALKITTELLDGGTEPMDVLGACKQAMEIIGQRFEAGEAFIPELIMGSEIMQQISDAVKPHMVEEAQTERLGKVVIGTVAGDIHDIGKNIVTFLLDTNGFEVHDLGVDVSPDRFIEAIAEVQPQIVGLSGFLTLSYGSMKTTVEAIEAAGLRDGIKIVVGGGQINEKIKEYASADAYGKDALAAVALAKGWVGG
jgi:5-methyltetrahydrofolate--homocysteine methyltransferase